MDLPANTLGDPEYLEEVSPLDDPLIEFPSDFDPISCPHYPGSFKILSCLKRKALLAWTSPQNRTVVRHVVKHREIGTKKWIILHHFGAAEPPLSGKEYYFSIHDLLPGRLYEFGINIVGKEEGDFLYRNYSNETCACQTSADRPDPPTKFKYHYDSGTEYVFSWIPGADNGAPLERYYITSIPSNVTASNSTSQYVSANITSARLTILDQEPCLVELQAINSVGPSTSASLTLHPPRQPNFEVQPPGASIAGIGVLTAPQTYGLFGCAAFLLLLFVLFTLVFYKKKKSRHALLLSRADGIELSALAPLWSQEVNSMYGADPPDADSIDRVPHIPSGDVRFLRYLGCGAFGKVWEGWLRSITDTDEKRYERVALKVRNAKALSEDEFKREAVLMFKYQHPNIVRLIGVSFDRPSQECLVLEMMEHGNLREYLHKARPCRIQNRSIAAQPIRSGEDDMIEYSAELDLPALMTIMRDIVRGCKYLDDQHFVHRDIAARNCLVSHRHQSGRIIKMSDFGLARDVYKNDYYRRRNEPKLPVRWMSPEAIRDGLFTSKSDVWAFAVTCWEALTLGADPYYGSNNADVMNLVMGGQVLQKPENCPPELYDQLLLCWSHFAQMRPCFADLVIKMEEFCAMSKDPESPFSKPFIQRVPQERRLRGNVDAYEGHVSSPTTEQTMLTSGEAGANSDRPSTRYLKINGISCGSDVHVMEEIDLNGYLLNLDPPGAVGGGSFPLEGAVGGEDLEQHHNLCYVSPSVELDEEDHDYQLPRA